MADRNDGGQAFPSSFVGPYGTESSKVGMTLRDWFAGQALAGMHARDTFDIGMATPEQRAALAYIDADAMLAERAK